VITISNLTVALGDDDLTLPINNLNFIGKSGDIVWVKGANGSGKTTLFRTICGFIKPHSGKIDLLNSSKVCYIGHKLFLLQDSNALNHYEWFCLLSNCKKLDIKEFKCLLSHFDINDEDLLVSNMSSGQKKKLLFLYLYFTNANIILLDEIFVNIDKVHKEKMQISLKNDFEDSLIMYSSHEEINISNRVLSLS
jgi:ABC-type transport system involved in cytochrome c biogenesis ATPase subunit